MFGAGSLFLLLGVLLAEWARSSEPHAFATSCDSGGYVGGDLVEVRRVEGSGDPASQTLWRERLDIYVTSEAAASASTFDLDAPATSTDFELVRDTR